MVVIDRPNGAFFFRALPDTALGLPEICIFYPVQPHQLPRRRQLPAAQYPEYEAKIRNEILSGVPGARVFVRLENGQRLVLCVNRMF